MSQTFQKLDNRHRTGLSEAAPGGREIGGFKPLALRAVAAAARRCDPPAPRQPTRQDVPAVLRDDAPSN